MIGIDDEPQLAPEHIHTQLSPKAQRSLLVGARLLSTVFRPNYYPLVGFLILFNFTFLQLMPLYFRLYVVAMVYLFTLAIPSLGIYVYRQLKGMHIQELREKHKRLVPYIINILCYLLCMHFVWSLRLPSFVLAVVAMSVWVQCVCTLVTIWWKVSMHSAGAGTIIGALVAYSSAFQFNPVWWLCVAIMISGLVGSSRMLLRRHTLWQVLGGTWIGVLCGLVAILVL